MIEADNARIVLGDGVETASLAVIVWTSATLGDAIGGRGLLGGHVDGFNDAKCNNAEEDVQNPFQGFHADSLIKSLNDARLLCPS